MLYFDTFLANIYLSKFRTKSLFPILYTVESRELELSFNSTEHQHSVCAQPPSCFVGRCQISSLHQTCDFLTYPISVLWIT